MNRKSSQSRKWQELFTLLKLSEPEQQAAQAYLAGAAGEEALAKISFLDLSAVPEALPKKRFYDLIQKKNRIGLEDVKADMGRLFELLFARGKSTCYAMVPPEIFRILNPTEWWDAPRMTAVHAVQVGMENFLHSHWLLSVLEVAGKKPEILRQALDLEVNAAPHGKFVLLALYFAEKYPKSIKFVPTAEDLPLFLQYEEMAVSFFGDLYFGKTDAAFLEELSQELAAGKIPERFASFPGMNAQVSREKLKLTAGLSYWNYTCSETLKNIVRLCFWAGMPETLDALYTMSRGTKVDICTKGGRYDEEFGLDGEEYLCWAVKGSHRNIMRKQLAENTECYVRVMERMPADYANKMFLLMKEEKPERYEEILAQQKKNGNSAEKEKLIDALVRQDANWNAVQEWLRGESTLAE